VLLSLLRCFAALGRLPRGLWERARNDLEARDELGGVQWPAFDALVAAHGVFRPLQDDDALPTIDRVYAVLDLLES